MVRFSTAHIDPARLGVARSSPPRAVIWWAVAAAAPLVLVAVRALVSAGHVYLNGDFALMDMQVRAALHGALSVGVHGRYGWHHPGPVYLYLISFVERLTGTMRGAQAQVAAAALVGAGSVFGTVLVIGRLGGTLGAAVGAVVGAAVTIASGSSLASPWSPNVVVLPVLLLGVLALAAARGSPVSWAAAVVVATFVVQSDVETTLYAVVVVAGSGLLLVRRRRLRCRHSRPGVAGPARRRSVVGVLLVVALAAWVPALVNEASSSGGNLSAIARFLLHARGRAGFVNGAATASRAEFSSIGLKAPAFATASTTPGMVWLAVIVMVAAALLLGAHRARDELALGLAVVFTIGTFVAVVSAAGIVGPPLLYLMAWSSGVGATGVLALAISGARYIARHWSISVALGCARIVGVAAVAAFVVVGLRATALARLQSGEVTSAWNVLSPRLGADIEADGADHVDSVSVAQHTTGVIALAGPLWGLVDELDLHGFHPHVGRQWLSTVGASYVASRNGSVAVDLYPPTTGATGLVGFAGHTRYADIVIRVETTSGRPSP
jgi:hypothetical protein